MRQLQVVLCTYMWSVQEVAPLGHGRRDFIVWCPNVSNCLSLPKSLLFHAHLFFVRYTDQDEEEFSLLFSFHFLLHQHSFFAPP